MRFFIVALLALIVMSCSKKNKDDSKEFWELRPLANLPEATTNNAVVEGFIDGKPYVYSFAGLDSSKAYSWYSSKILSL